MTAENTEFKMTYLDLQAYAGVTKHMSGFEATNELLSLCHIQNAQQVLDVGCEIGVGPAYIVKTYGCHVVGSVSGRWTMLNPSSIPSWPSSTHSLFRT